MNTAQIARPITARDHLEMMYHKSRWPVWPLLPLKHSTKKDPEIPGMPLTGFLATGEGATVFVGIIGLWVKSTQPYPDFEAVVADGWVVD